MKSIRKFAYAALLTLSALNFAPSLAAQEPARGAFTLTHEVHWQKNIVPAGEYSFRSIRGPSATAHSSPDQRGRRCSLHDVGERRR